MQADRKELAVFGCGLALIIPYLIFFHSLSLGFSLKSVCILLGGFITVLWVITKISEWPIAANSWIFAVQGAVYWFVMREHGTPLKWLFFTVAVGMLVVALINLDWLRPLYKVWMKAAHFISHVITNATMVLMFYGVFAPIGIFFRIIGKDHLNRKLEPEKKSYWQIRKSVPFDPERYKQQF